ncbi:MAG: class 1 fructose-1,6-bisphosphatase [Sandaracinaceae bacterium]
MTERTLEDVLGHPPPGDAEGETRVAVLAELADLAKVLSALVRRSALEGLLGAAGRVNATGDSVKALDLRANEIVVERLVASRLLAGIVSEELEELKPVSCEPMARHILAIDPVDGSSNVAVNGPLGTIFGLYRRRSTQTCGMLEAELVGGQADLVAAGYVLYGPATMLVVAGGDDVRGFTLDEESGRWRLSHPALRIPEDGPTLAANLGRQAGWSDATRAFVDEELLREGSPKSQRYLGALVADVHRCLIEGGVYLYPAERAHPDGKLRQLYECAPMAFIAERAGGAGTDGRGRILERTVRTMHDRSPIAVGSRAPVERYQATVGGASSRP